MLNHQAPLLEALEKELQQSIDALNEQDQSEWNEGYKAGINDAIYELKKLMKQQAQLALIEIFS